MLRTVSNHRIATACLRSGALALLFLLAGCSSLATQQNNPELAANEPAGKPQEVSSKPKPIPVETLYGLLTAEIAGQRQRYDVALVHYMRQAKATKDPIIAERAARIAQFLGQKKYILQTLNLWMEAAPNNPQVYLIAAQVFMDYGDYEQALANLMHLQDLTQQSQYDFLAANAGHLERTAQQALLEQFTQMRQQTPQDASLWLACGLMQQHLGNFPQALSDINHSLKLAPKSLTANLQKARLLTLLGQPAQSIKLLNKLQRAHPEHKGVQVLKARIYLDQKKLPEAKQAFANIQQNFPLDPSIILSLALISEELGEKEDAREYFYQLLAIQEFTNEAHFYLGRMADNDQMHDYAIEQYGQVSSGSEFFPAKLRATVLTKEHYGLEAAQQFLQEQVQEYPQHRVNLLRIEAELLVENKQFQEAQGLLSEALEEKVDNIELLYSRAMVAERNGDLAQLETDLRRILELDPENINALNALGYTFADHHYNLTEALELVQKARELSPDNPAIADSLGWVYFRLGDLEQAEQLLHEAFSKIEDHEIAAHYGELLWLQGNKEQALEVWHKGYQSQPNSPLLEKTFKRLKISPAWLENAE